MNETTTPTSATTETQATTEAASEPTTEAHAQSEQIVTVRQFRCTRCGYAWIPHNPERKPKSCPNPKCRSPYWDKPRAYRKADKPAPARVRKPRVLPQRVRPEVNPEQPEQPASG